MDRTKSTAMIVGEKCDVATAENGIGIAGTVEVGVVASGVTATTTDVDTGMIVHRTERREAMSRTVISEGTVATKIRLTKILTP